MLSIIAVIIKAVWLMLPAYIANPTAVVFGGGTPIDFGKNWRDGRRILGSGKTFRGLFGGTACGVIIGLLQRQATASDIFIIPSITAIITLSSGALLGDIVKSFFKRRLGFERGAKLPLIDQLDFVAGAWILTYIFDPQWFNDNFTFWIIITVLILTPVLHRLTNILGYYIKVKKEPW
ncbi:MAG: CDP-2,3-bis-(O-geranylgeranyl)-sn-glycerol synthase [Euryarchaeota archaeon]|nr:CDP-2,3-bis-(O-geranylgeranyl)-sn-glycerol synthase [Euryarchaeota archaeon]MBU4491953.1 CDP-2,3-bis-(O-geranylgeranyl)-sn-glycerol synthase [Euryarchaeota archaeon]